MRSVLDIFGIRCLRDGHEWVDDGFMGDGEICARCGRFDDSSMWPPSRVTCFLAGFALGAYLIGYGMWVVSP